MNRRDGVIFLLIGAAALGVTRQQTPFMIALLVLAFAGVWIVTGARAAKWLMVAPPVSHLLTGIWTIVPERLMPERDGTLHALPPGVGAVLLQLALLASVVLAARGIGWGLATLACTQLVLSIGSVLLAGTVRVLPDNLNRDLVAQVRGAGEWYGHLGGGTTFVAVCWVVLALAPHETAPIRSRKLAVLGVAGALLVGAALRNMIDMRGTSASTVAVVLFGVGWVLTILGSVGVARSGGRGLAWTGVFFLVLQIVQCVAMAAGISTSGRVLVAMWLTAGPIGLALVAFAGDLPVRPIRTLVCAFFVAAAAGSFLENVGVLLDLEHVVRITGDPSEWWTYKRLAAPAMEQGLLVWGAVLAYLVAPPSPDTSTVKAPADQMRSSG